MLGSPNYTIQITWLYNDAAILEGLAPAQGHHRCGVRFTAARV